MWEFIFSPKRVRTLQTLGGWRWPTEHTVRNFSIRFVGCGFPLTRSSLPARWVAENGEEKRLPGLPYSPKQLFWVRNLNTDFNFSFWFAKSSNTPSHTKHDTRGQVYEIPFHKSMFGTQNLKQKVGAAMVWCGKQRPEALRNAVCPNFYHLRHFCSPR